VVVKYGKAVKQMVEKLESFLVPSDESAKDAVEQERKEVAL
jgi:hypothetical protein